MSQSVRLHVPWRSAKDGNLLVEIVSNDFRHFQIEGYSGCNPEDRFSVSVSLLPDSSCSQSEAQKAADIAGRNDRIDDLNRSVVGVDLHNDLSRVLVGHASLRGRSGYDFNHANSAGSSSMESIALVHLEQVSAA